MYILIDIHINIYIYMYIFIDIHIYFYIHIDIHIYLFFSARYTYIYIYICLFEYLVFACLNRWKVVTTPPKVHVPIHSRKDWSRPSRSRGKICCSGRRRRAANLLVQTMRVESSVCHDWIHCAYGLVHGISFVRLSCLGSCCPSNVAFLICIKRCVFDLR